MGGVSDARSGEWLRRGVSLGGQVREGVSSAAWPAGTLRVGFGCGKCGALVRTCTRFRQMVGGVRDGVEVRETTP